MRARALLSLPLLFEKPFEKRFRPTLKLVLQRTLHRRSDVYRHVRTIDRAIDGCRNDDAAVLLRVAAQVGARLRRELSRERDVTMRVERTGRELQPAAAFDVEVAGRE